MTRPEMRDERFRMFRPTLLSLVVLAVLAGSCSKRETEEERNATSGPLVVLATKEYLALADTLAEEFAKQYPGVRQTIIPSTTREAIVGLLNDSVSTVFVDRALNEEERGIATEAGIAVHESRVAVDALVPVVHRDNTVKRFTRAMLASIVGGSTASWRSVDGSGRTDEVEFVTTERNSGLYEVIQAKVLGSSSALRVFAAGQTQAECVSYVARSPRALSLVSLTAVRTLPKSVRIVPVEAPIDSSGQVLADVMPTQTTVFTGEYPLGYDLFVVTSERRSLTGSGFATFIRTTQGQKIVQSTGLVPDVIPNRVIQLSSE